MANSCKVLVVDDNLVVLKTFEAKLKAGGFNVITAREAAEAVGIARKEKPDLIVLDINFPPPESFTSLQWDGLNTLQWFKRYEDVAAIPIVVITSATSEEYKKQALGAGAAAFYIKPVNFDELLAAIPGIAAPK